MPCVFSPKVISLSTKPSSNEGLKEYVKPNHRSPLRTTLKDCYSSRSPQVKSVLHHTLHHISLKWWIYITAQLVHLPSPASYLFLPQVLFAGLLRTGNKNTVCMANNIIKSTSQGTLDIGCSPGTWTIMRSWRADTCEQPESWKMHPGASLSQFNHLISIKCITGTWPEANWQGSLRNDCAVISEAVREIESYLSQSKQENNWWNQ